MALTTDNIFPVKRRQGTGTPAVTYRRIGGERHYTMQGYATLENPHIEVVVHSSTLDALRAVGDAMISALSSATGFKMIAMESPVDDFDDVVGMYSRVYDVSIWNKE